MPEITNPKVKFVVATLGKAGISQSDFARLTQISRETLYRWKIGGRITDNLRLNIAYSYALRLEKARVAGRLPLTDRLKKDQRITVLRKIIAEMAK